MSSDAMKITLCEPSMTDGAIKMRVIKSLARKIRGKIFAKCCGYPSCPPPPGVSQAYCSLDWAAAAAVKDGDVLAVVGLAGNISVSSFIFALVRRHKTTGSPRNLTIVSHGGNGGRGKLPGSLDDLLALPGLVNRFFVSHVDTHIFAKKRMLDPTDRLEVHIFPLGVMSLIYASMAEGGPPSISVTTGVGTVFDPRIGRGSPLTPGLTTQWVAVAKGGAELTYTLPTITCAVLNAAAADPSGKIYRRGMSMVSDGVEVARAAKRGGGHVVVCVGLLVEPGYGEELLGGHEVDCLVLDHSLEQCVGAEYLRPWPFLTLEDQGGWTAADGARVISVINTMLKITPLRSPVDALLGRLGAHLFATHCKPGSRINIGTGLPEEVGKAMEAVSRLIEPFNEGGALGGVSASGCFFGAAVLPTEIVSSAEVYRRVYKKYGGRLDCVVVGGLEVDETGSVNVAARKDPLGYVGPGGFVDLTNAADVCIFAVSFATHARLAVEGGAVRVHDAGTCKFVSKVREVHFSGPNALAAGKKCFYVTHLGAFELTSQGMQLLCVFPGVDVLRDIVEVSPMKIVLPVGGAGGVSMVQPEIVGGMGFEALLEKALRGPLAAL